MNAHVPVMADEVAEALRLTDGGCYVDCTFGLGGYTETWLARAACRVVAIDRDPTAVAIAVALAERHEGRVIAIEGRFGDIEALLADRGIDGVEGIAMDLGVSSPQLDQPERGFSFGHDGPLDMRMGAGDVTAADIVNGWAVERLATLFRRYGEEKRAAPIARAIDRARSEAPIETTGRLASVIAAAVPGRTQRIHPATRVFQAIRIAVNDELGELRRGLVGAERLLKPGGRLAVVSFHSLEDRMVKRFLATRAGATGRGSRHRPEAAPGPQPSFTLIGRGAATASEAEVARNPRSRSAKLRAAERTAAPAWPADMGFEGIAA